MKSIKWNRELLELWDGGQRILNVEAGGLLAYSTVRPWSMENRRWKEIHREETGSGGRLVCRDELVEAALEWRCEEDYLMLGLSFENLSGKELAEFAGGLSLPVEKGDDCKVTIPHVIYNDNPSADPKKIVPHIGKKAGEGIIVEEHRLPVPGVNVEWKGGSGGFPFLTLCALPQVDKGLDREYWSLGVVRGENGVNLTVLSGPLMFNGMKDVTYGGRCTPLSYQGGYRALGPGERIVKRLCLDFGAAGGEGSEAFQGKGFRNLIVNGYRLLKPRAQAHEDYESMIRYKLNVADSRFFRDGEACGYLTFGSANSFGNLSGRPDYFLYGWTGQTIKIAWCECMYGLERRDAARVRRALEVVDFYVMHGKAPVPGLMYGYYMVEEGSWRGGWKTDNDPLSARILGEAISDVLDVMLLLKGRDGEGIQGSGDCQGDENSRGGGGLSENTHICHIKVPAAWEDTVREVCGFLMDEQYQTKNGIYPFAWRKDGVICGEEVNASGMPCVAVLAKAYEYFGDERYLSYARKKYDTYAHLHMDTFDIPFARATMDASCEDKEAGIYFFLCAWELFRITGEDTYREWAAICGDWLLTFVFFWNTGFRPGTVCAEKAFDTTGWPGVSVQNHHLDVFFPSYELYAFGKVAGEERFAVMGKNIRNAMTQGICTKPGEWGFDLVGEQGEHYYHTNYVQSRYPGVLSHLADWRGGNQVWNPSWITAQVLRNNLLFWKDAVEKNAAEKVEMDC